MRRSRKTLVSTVVTGLLLFTVSPAASQWPPRTDGGPPTGPAPGFSLTEDLTRLDLTREQLERIKMLENDIGVKMESLLKELEECTEDDPYGRRALELRSQISTVIEQSWRAMREVLTEEQLRQLFIVNPTHPLVQDEAPRFIDTVDAVGGSDAGSGPGGVPPNHGGW
jgi:hypothetical protein